MKQVVNKLQARRLRDLGYTDPCLYHYNGDELFWNINETKDGLDIFNSYNKQFKDEIDPMYIDAPNVSDVLLWFNQKYQIELQVTHATWKEGQLYYKFNVYDISNPYNIGLEGLTLIHQDIEKYYPIDDAYLAGISYVLFNVIKNKKAK